MYKGEWCKDVLVDKEGFGGLKPTTDVTSEDALDLISKGQ
jgi:hypothetical protein